MKSQITVNLAALLILLAVLGSIAHGQANFANSFMMLDIPGNFPSFSISSLLNGVVLQETDIVLIGIAEYAFQGELPIENSTLVPGSLVQALDLLWTLNAYDSTGDNGFAQANLSCKARNNEWSLLTLTLTWNNVITTNSLVMSLSVDDYEWDDNSSSATLTFMFGMSSPNISATVLPSITPQLTLQYGSEWWQVSNNAIVTDSDSPTAPVFLWLDDNTLMLSIGYFQGNVTEQVAIGINPLPTQTPPPPNPNSPDYGTDALVLFVGCLVVGLIAIVLVIGGALYLNAQSQKAAYEPI